MAGVSPREPYLPEPRELERDLRAGVARADDEHWTVGQIERAAILARVDLLLGRRQPRRERRHERPLERPGRHHDVIGFVPTIVS
jgi:hypothetical protein